MCFAGKATRRRNSLSVSVDEADPTDSASFDDYVLHTSTSRPKKQNRESVESTATLGSKEQHKKDKHCIRHDYHDHSCDLDKTSAAEKIKPTIARGGITLPFPVKLYKMLDHIHNKEPELADIVSWQPHGRSFLVHEPKAFADNVLAMFFQQKKYASFQRQLNLYGFSRITKGPDRGSYYHELFLRGKEFLCRGIIRSKIKGTGARMKSNPDAEPNFYCMPAVPSSYECDNGISSESTISAPPILTLFTNEEPSYVQSNPVPLQIPVLVPVAETSAGPIVQAENVFSGDTNVYGSGCQNTVFFTELQAHTQTPIKPQTLPKNCNLARNRSRFLDMKMPPLNKASEYPLHQQTIHAPTAQENNTDFVFDNMPFHSIGHQHHSNTGTSFVTRSSVSSSDHESMNSNLGNLPVVDTTILPLHDSDITEMFDILEHIED